MDRAFAGIALLSITDEDFADPRHRLVLSGIRHTLERGQSPDPVTVLGELRRLGMLPSFLDDNTAGPFLAEVYAAAPIVEQAGHYRRIVLEHAFRRRVAETAARLDQLAGTSALETLRDTLHDEWTTLHASYQRVDGYSAADGVVE